MTRTCTGFVMCCGVICLVLGIATSLVNSDFDPVIYVPLMFIHPLSVIGYLCLATGLVAWKMKKSGVATQDEDE